MDAATPTLHAFEDAAGAVHALVARLNARVAGAPVDTRAVATLGRLAFANPVAQLTAVDAGVMPQLMGMLLSPRGARRVHRVALATLLILVHDNATAQAAAVNTGMLWALSLSLVTESSSVTTLALLVVHALTARNEANRLKALEARVVRALVRVTREDFSNERCLAARVLLSLDSDNSAGLEVMVHDLLVTDDRIEIHDDSAPALALAVLTQCLAQPDDALAYNLEVLGVGTDQYGVLLALEELFAVASKLSSLPSSTVEAVEATAVPLCVRYLHSRVDAEQSYAAQTLAMVLNHNDSLRAPVTAALGGVAAVVEMLAGGSRAVVFVLYWLLDGVRTDTHAEAAAAGAIESLVRVLSGGCLRERLVAVATLGCLIPHNQAEALHAGAMAPLVRLLQDVGTTNMLSEVMEVVSALVGDNGDVSAKDAFVTAGGAAVLVRVLTDGVPADKCRAATLAVKVSTAHALAQAAFTDAGVLAPLVKLLESDVTAEINAAALALCVFSENHTPNKAAIVGGTALGRLASLLHAGTHENKLVAAFVVHSVAKGDADAQAAFARAGILTSLVQMIGLGHGEAPYVAAEALASLVRGHASNQAMAFEADAAPALFRMVCRGSDRHRQTALAALACLVNESEVQAGEAGGLRLLVTMVQAPLADSLPADCTRGAASAIQELVTTHPAMHAAAVEAGVIEALVTLVRKATDDKTLFIKTLTEVIKHREAVNATAQGRALDAGVVDVLVAVLRSSSDDGQDHVAALAALQSIIEAYPTAQEVLLATDALRILSRMLQDDATSSSAATLVISLVSDGNAAAVTASWDANIVATLVERLEHKDDDARALALYTLASLVSADKTTRPRMAEMVPHRVLVDMLESSDATLKTMALGFALLITEQDTATQSVSSAMTEEDGGDRIETESTSSPDASVD